MCWMSRSYEKAEVGGLRDLRAEAKAAALAVQDAAAPGSAAQPQALVELPGCVRRYLELSSAASSVGYTYVLFCCLLPSAGRSERQWRRAQTSRCAPPITQQVGDVAPGWRVQVRPQRPLAAHDRHSGGGAAPPPHLLCALGLCSCPRCPPPATLPRCCMPSAHAAPLQCASPAAPAFFWTTRCRFKPLIGIRGKHGEGDCVQARLLAAPALALPLHVPSCLPCLPSQCPPMQDSTAWWAAGAASTGACGAACPPWPPAGRCWISPCWCAGWQVSGSGWPCCVLCGCYIHLCMPADVASAFASGLCRQRQATAALTLHALPALPALAIMQRRPASLAPCSPAPSCGGRRWGGPRTVRCLPACLQPQPAPAGVV